MQCAVGSYFLYGIQIRNDTEGSVLVETIMFRNVHIDSLMHTS